MESSSYPGAPGRAPASGGRMGSGDASPAAGGGLARRVASGVAAFVVALLGSVAFFVPSASAGVVVPLVAGVPCVGSSLCSPETPEIMAALAEQGGTVAGVPAAAPALSATESAAFDGIVANYGATAATDGSQIVGAVGSAAPSGFSWQTAFGLVTTGFGLLTGVRGITDLMATQGPVLSNPASLPSGSTAASGGWSGPLAYTNRVSIGGPPPTLVADFTEQLNVTGIDSSGFHASVVAFQGANEVGGGAVSAPNPAFTFYKSGVACGSASETLTYTTVNNTQNASADVSVIGTAYGVSCSSGGGWTDVTSFTVHFNQVGFPTLTFTQSSTPSRYVETSITCSNGQVIKTDGPPVTAATAGTFFPMSAGACPNTMVANSVTETLKTQGGSDVVLSTATTGSTVRSLTPGCFTATAACTLKLSVLRSGTSTTWDNCFTLGNACAGWWTQPQSLRSTQYKCEFGSASTWVLVNIYACSVYQNAFDPGNPQLTSPQKPPSQAPNQNCDLGWSSVLDGTIMQKAVSCALAWAFVPDEATVQDFTTQVSGAWDASAPGVIVDEANSVGAPLRGLSSASAPDCNGPYVDLEWYPGTHYTGYPFANCDGFQKQMADIFTPLVGAVALIGAFGIGVRILTGTIGLGAPKAVA